MNQKVSSHIFSIITLSMLLMSLLLTSCVENSGLRSKVSKLASNVSEDDEDEDETPIEEIPAAPIQSVKVELSHLVDPFDGTYKKKVTIPKNYKGNLYIAGLNVSALSGKLVKVRFNYGIDRQSVVLDATVARAPGIIPQTDIQVLVVNMNSRPLNKMRLPYDLYDYNDYASDPSKEPVTNGRDSGLYCRGLQVADDPTSTNSTTCTRATDKCLYSYAKITDATLYNSATGLTNLPSRPQVWTTTNGVRNPTISSSASTMCLPDSEDKDALNSLYSLSLGGLSIPTTVLGMQYRGPYRAINPDGWAITSLAIYNSDKKGLYEVASGTAYSGYRSLMFPRAGRLDLPQDAKYLGSSDRFGVTSKRSVQVASGGVTPDYVDGCNLRVQNYNVATTEGINSCNVNGSIEVFYMKDNVEVNITTDKSIKLQVIRPSLTDSEGKEVLNTSFKRCETSSTCGTGECCFNSRCWSNDLVSQCVDTTPIIGNQENGANCASDYECSSLCCNASKGTCSPHSTTGTSPILCSKLPGESCVAREFCAKEAVNVCKMVKARNNDGSATCNLRCSPVETFGTCSTAGRCVPPVTPPMPIIDPLNPCKDAVDP